MRVTLILSVVAVAVALQAAIMALGKFPVHTSGGILVTGASSGIGEHAAAALVKEGFTVFAGVRKARDAERLAKAYPGIRTVLLDVTRSDSIAAAVATVSSALKAAGDLPLVALCSNAGVQKDLPVELQDPKNDRFTFDVNVFGLLDTTRAFLPLLRKTGKGARIVNMGSLAGVCSAPGSATYSASKFAVEGVTDALRLEMAEFGISVSLIQPGYVRSRMGEKAHDGAGNNHYGVGEASYKLYQHVFDGFLAKDKELASPENAEDPATTTTAAYLHAITSAYPKTRYAVASVDGLPAWLIVLVKSVLPDRIMDLLV